MTVVLIAAITDAPARSKPLQTPPLSPEAGGQEHHRSPALPIPTRHRGGGP